jgi:hypothetical protein
MTFSITIEYDAPEIEGLKEALKESAEASLDGKSVTVGETTAKKVGFYTELFNGCSIWHVFAPDLNGPVIHTFRGGSRSATNEALLESMASHEARRTLDDESRNRALKQALQHKLDSL